MKMYEHRVSGDPKHSSNIMENGFSFGNHQDVGPGGRAYVEGKILEFFATRGVSK